VTEDKYSILKKYFGYTAFRPGQAEVIDAILAGRDALAVMPTGAGKSLCYQIPALMLEGLTVVISPLISLMKDQVSSLREAGVSTAFLNSSLSPAEYNQTMDDILRGDVKILYVAPERLQKAEALRFAEALPIPLVVVDEAHCVSQWGHDFRPSYLQITEFINSIKPRPLTAAFTATATPKVQEDIKRVLSLEDAPDGTPDGVPNPHWAFSITTGFDRANLYFEVQRPRNREAALLEYLARRQDKSGIVYCATRKTVEEVHRILVQQGYAAARYHAGLEDDERRKSQEDFLYDRKTLMVATNAFGMGIDKSNVSFVIHYNMPKNIESYYQEAGRAGRDGEKADCILFYSPQDVRINTFLITSNAGEERDDKQIEHNLELLKQMTFYATTSDCLRGRFLSYFGETAPHYCGNCSNCLTEYENIDITVETQKILSCVYRLKERGRAMGKTMVINILRGSKDKKILSSKLDTLSTWGIMADCGVHRLRIIVDYLIDKDYLVLQGDEYPVLSLTPRFRDVMNGQASLTMMLPKEPKVPEPKVPDPSLPELSQPLAEAAGAGDELLFDKLRVLRKELSQAAAVPAYIVFSDASLRDMSRKQPQNREQFLGISGVGPAKLEKYGESFIALIRSHQETLDAE
jgi:ATP-dependent DNA helicase RecQ